MDTTLRDNQIAKLRQAGIPDDQITLALATSDALLAQMQKTASAHEDSALTLRDVMAAMAGEPKA
ncbi:MAG: hypothetical protein ACON4P_05245 [Candidatus Puniceispirillales bacterium]